MGKGKLTEEMVLSELMDLVSQKLKDVKSGQAVPYRKVLRIKANNFFSKSVKTKSDAIGLNVQLTVLSHLFKQSLDTKVELNDEFKNKLLQWMEEYKWTLTLCTTGSNYLQKKIGEYHQALDESAEIILRRYFERERPSEVRSEIETVLSAFKTLITTSVAKRFVELHEVIYEKFPEVIDDDIAENIKHARKFLKKIDKNK